MDTTSLFQKRNQVLLIPYNLIIQMYGALIWVAQPFSSQARKWISGRHGIWKKIAAYDSYTNDTIWIHSSSLGEFEQGRPLIEALKKKSPEIRIVVTFFSPSGYEIRKNYSVADQIFYLPLDTKNNAERFIHEVNPALAIFIKYDFWFNYLSTLAKHHIPFIFISSVFRKNHYLFKKWAKPFLKILRQAEIIFVQDQLSAGLLKENNCPSIVAGDTRVDRVIQLQKNLKKYNQLKKIIQSRKTMIFGSVWPDDILIVQRWITESLRNSADFILLAPHDVSEKMINRIKEMLDRDIQRFSEIHTIANGTKIIIIDTIGDLAHLYALADLAYIGGGFGKSIHSILEPAAAGLPVIFGPKYQKFKEAQDLIDLRAARSIKSAEEFIQAVDYFSNKGNKELALVGLKEFLNEHRGATQKIVHYLTERNLIS